MRRLLILLAITSFAIAGCGGDSDADSPLDEALGYLPDDAPLAVIVSTDLESDSFQAGEEAVRNLPFGPLFIQQFEQQLEGGEVDFEEDVRPLLGNDAVIGVGDPRALLADDVEGFVAALQTRDGDKLRELLDRETEEIGEAEGATLYEGDDETVAAVKDDVLILSDSQDRLREALEQREADDRLREADLEAAFEELPDEAPARIYANVEALLEADPSTEQARRVPFVNALETFAATATIEDDRVAFDFKLNTDGSLEEAELPIAAGDESPPVIGQGAEIGAGIRSPAHIVEFAESVGQIVSPEGFSEYQQAKQQIAQGLDVDLDRDVIEQFSGNTSVAFELDGDFAIRSELENPQAFEDTLERLVDVIPNFAEGAGLGDVGVARPSGDEDFYAVAGEDGEGVVYGVVDDVFVLASDPDRAAALASEQPQQVEGAEGAIVLRADAQEVARSVISQLGGTGGLQFELPLGLLTGSLAAGDDGLRGQLSLELQE